MSPPACSEAPFRRRRSALAAGALSIALALGVITPALASPLTERRDQVKAEVEAARDQIHEQTGELEQASAALEAAQTQLAEAHDRLASTRAALEEAKKQDAALAVRLAQEQELLRAAKAAADEARERADEQRERMAEAARESYQKQTSLTGLGVVLGAETMAEASQRLQWDTTIFDTTNQRLAELKVLQARLEQAEREQAAVEASIAASKKQAEELVATQQSLEAEAVAQEAAVQDLVARNAELQQAAEKALADDLARFAELQAEEASIQAELVQRAGGNLAGGLSRDDIAALVAAGAISRNPAGYPLVADGPQRVLSEKGFIRPVKARPGSPFGQRFHPILKYWRQHNGTDFGAACGTPLYAAQSGTVASARVQGGFGNYVVVDHGVIGGRSLMTGYAHMSSMAVKAGQKVSMGEYLGTVGTTGLSTGCHLHLQVYENGTPVNPMNYIP
ncbi:MAG: peptidoglycan DD-metalloendopeptidase family protein [Propioniciclava sp.]|uniref:peptidoglycan DD-metalloendopeptidase family protein n=1 Tax=Propioniciclava sp. TaxID=2038686 RepID=UPI0039E38F38